MESFVLASCQGYRASLEHVRGLGFKRFRV